MPSSQMLNIKTFFQLSHLSLIPSICPLDQPKFSGLPPSVRILLGAYRAPAATHALQFDSPRDPERPMGPKERGETECKTEKAPLGGHSSQ